MNNKKKLICLSAVCRFRCESHECKANQKPNTHTAFKHVHHTENTEEDAPLHSFVCAAMPPNINTCGRGRVVSVSSRQQWSKRCVEHCRWNLYVNMRPKLQPQRMGESAAGRSGNENDPRQRGVTVQWIAAARTHFEVNHVFGSTIMFAARVSVGRSLLVWCIAHVTMATENAQCSP